MGCIIAMTYTRFWTEYLLVNKFARGNNGAIYPAELKLESFFFLLIELDQLVSVLYSDKCVIESMFFNLIDSILIIDRSKSCTQHSAFG